MTPSVHLLTKTKVKKLNLIKYFVLYNVKTVSRFHRSTLHENFLRCHTSKTTPVGLFDPFLFKSFNPSVFLRTLKIV